MKFDIRSPGARDPARGAVASRHSALATKVRTQHSLHSKYRTAGPDLGTETQEETVQDGHLEITGLIIKIALLDLLAHLGVLRVANTSNEIQDKAQLEAQIRTAFNLLKRFLGASRQLKGARIVWEAWRLVSPQSAAPPLTE